MSIILRLLSVIGAFVCLSLIAGSYLTIDYFNSLLIQVEANQSYYIVLSISFLILDIVSIIPAFLIIYTNGLVLGPFLGIFISILGLSIGSCLAYVLARSTKINKLFNQDLAWVRKLETLGPVAIILSRGIPGISELLSFYFGFSRMPFLLFLLSNIIGYLPICIVFVYFGNISKSPGYIALSLTITLFVALGFYLVQKRIMKKYALKESSVLK
jgi:uncharacterized membrane protein YdjX (TVP38/TMEM64 family)